MAVKGLSLEEFKAQLQSNSELKDKITNTEDYIDKAHGIMELHECNINRYLSKYACKDAEELSDVLWNSFGIFLRIV